MVTAEWGKYLDFHGLRSLENVFVNCPPTPFNPASHFIILLPFSSFSLLIKATKKCIVLAFAIVLGSKTDNKVDSLLIELFQY